MYEKYIGALPLYRQKKGFGLLCVSSRTPIVSWIITCSKKHLKSVYD
ncbi:hypothetical protein [Enterocloster asparagiformis]